MERDTEETLLARIRALPIARLERFVLGVIETLYLDEDGLYGLSEEASFPSGADVCDALSALISDYGLTPRDAQEEP